MLSVKNEVYSALCGIDQDLSVTDIYPTDWTKKYQVQYQETENIPYEKTDDVEQLTKVTYTLYAWSNGSLTSLCEDIDEVMSDLGLWRTGCSDANDPSGRRHKVMRYEGIVQTQGEKKYVFWNNNR